MTLTCPLCQSERVATLHRARKAAVAVGGVAGAVVSASSLWTRVRLGAWFGAQVGAGLGIVAGPVGTTFGAVLGEFLDDKLLDNHQCLACNHRFSAPASPLSTPSSAVPSTASSSDIPDWDTADDCVPARSADD